MRIFVRNFMKQFPAFFVALILVISQALSQSLPPLPGEPKNFELAEPTTFALENGLKVTFVQFGIVPKVSIAIVVNAGNLNEGDDIWLADVMGELLKEGTPGLSALDIAVAAADMGGALGVGVSLDQTTLSMDVLNDYAPDAIEMMADILQNPAFPASELPRIQQNFLRNISISETRPRSVAGRAFAGLIYGEHPYNGAFPSSEQLSAYTIEDVERFYDGNFGAARTKIYVVGQFDEAAMERVIHDAFEDWREGPAALNLPAEPASGLRVKLIDRPDSEQATVYLGLPVITVADEGYVPFQIMHTLLGGSFASRITQNIREDKGYTYSPRASISHRKGTAHWLQVADITNEFTGAALAEIFYEIRNLQDNVPPASELGRVQNYRAGVFVLQNGSRGGIIGQLASLDLQGMDSSFLNDYTGRVFEVSEENISALARDHLPLDQMTLVVVGDMSVIEDQIRELPELEGAEYLE